MAGYRWSRGTALVDPTDDIDDTMSDIDFEGLYLSSINTANDFTALERLGITHILTVSAPIVNITPVNFIWKSILIGNSGDENIARYFAECFAFIEEAKRKGGGVLVHCMDGVSRSATIVIAYLMVKDDMSLSQALDHVKSIRPVVSPKPGFISQLEKFDRTRKDKLVKLTFKVAVAKRRFGQAIRRVARKFD